MRLKFLLFLVIFCLTACVTSPAPSSRAKTYTIRLLPKKDLKLELARIAKELHLKAAAIVSGVGSLEKVALRFANQNESTAFDGYHEIVALQGTLSEDSMHIHLAVSDKSGKTSGGHLVEGNIIYTTCELVLLEQADLQFSREEDPTYGWKELVVKPSF